MNKIFSAAIGAASLGMVTAAQAAPQIFLNVFENGTQVAATPLNISLNSEINKLSFNGVTPSFIIEGNASGGFSASDPTFTTQTFTVSGRAQAQFVSPTTLRFEFTQTGIESSSAGGLAARFASTFTANFLSGSTAVQSVTLSNFANSSNTAFAREQLLATRTYTQNSVVDGEGPFIANASLTGSLFSETTIISAVFTAAGGRLQTSTQLVAVPEPATLALFGTALLGLGMVRRARRNKA